MSYKISWYKIQSIKTAPFSASVIKMMLAGHDLATGDAALKLYEGNLEKIPNQKIGFRHFIIKIQISVLREVIYGFTSRNKYKPGVIEQIKNEEKLDNIVDSCSEEAKKAFSRLYSCCPGQKDEAKFKQYVKKLRDKIGFHYDSDKITQALEEISNRKDTTKIQAGTDISRWRFEIADDITDEIVCSLWDVKYSDKRVSDANVISTWVNNRAKDYLLFSGEFILKYFSAYITSA